jgi:hypothetical protein
MSQGRQDESRPSSPSDTTLQGSDLYTHTIAD